MSYIVISRRSPSARALDVELDDDDRIKVYDRLPAGPHRVLNDEDDLIAFISSQETAPQLVETGLAHRILGWKIP